MSSSINILFYIINSTCRSAIITISSSSSNLTYCKTSCSRRSNCCIYSNTCSTICCRNTRKRRFIWSKFSIQINKKSTIISRYICTYCWHFYLSFFLSYNIKYPFLFIKNIKNILIILTQRKNIENYFSPSVYTYPSLPNTPDFSSSSLTQSGSLVRISSNSSFPLYLSVFIFSKNWKKVN